MFAVLKENDNRRDWGSRSTLSSIVFLSISTRCIASAVERGTLLSIRIEMEVIWQDYQVSLVFT